MHFDRTLVKGADKLLRILSKKQESISPASGWATTRFGRALGLLLSMMISMVFFGILMVGFTYRGATRGWLHQWFPAWMFIPGSPEQAEIVLSFMGGAAVGAFVALVAWFRARF